MPAPPPPPPPPPSALMLAAPTAPSGAAKLTLLAALKQRATAVNASATTLMGTAKQAEPDAESDVALAAAARAGSSAETEQAATTVSAPVIPTQSAVVSPSTPTSTSPASPAVSSAQTMVTAASADSGAHMVSAGPSTTPAAIDTTTGRSTDADATDAALAVFTKHGPVHFRAGFWSGWKRSYLALRSGDAPALFQAPSAATLLAASSSIQQLSLAAATTFAGRDPSVFEVAVANGSGWLLRAATESDAAAWRRAIAAASAKHLGRTARNNRQRDRSSEVSEVSTHGGNRISEITGMSTFGGKTKTGDTSSSEDGNADSDDEWTVVCNVAELLPAAAAILPGSAFAFVHCAGHGNGTFYVTATRIDSAADHETPNDDRSSAVATETADTHAVPANACTDDCGDDCVEQYTQTFTASTFEHSLGQLLALQPALESKLPPRPRGTWLARLTGLGGAPRNLDPFTACLHAAAAHVGAALVLDIFFGVRVGAGVEKALFTSAAAQLAKDAGARLHRSDAELHAHYEARRRLPLATFLPGARSQHAQEDSLLCAVAEAREAHWECEREPFAVHLTLAREQLTVCFGEASAAELLKRAALADPADCSMEMEAASDACSEQPASQLARIFSRITATTATLSATTLADCRRWLGEAAADHAALGVLREQRTRHARDTIEAAAALAAEEHTRATAAQPSNAAILQRLAHRADRLAHKAGSAKRKWLHAYEALIRRDARAAVAAVTAQAAAYTASARDYVGTVRATVAERLFALEATQERALRLEREMSQLQQEACMAELATARKVSANYRLAKGEREAGTQRVRQLEGRLAGLRAQLRTTEQKAATMLAEWHGLQQQHAAHTKASALKEAHRARDRAALTASAAARRQAATRLHMAETGGDSDGQDGATGCQSQDNSPLQLAASRRRAAQRAKTFSETRPKAASSRASKDAAQQDTADRVAQLAAARRLAQQRISSYFVLQARAEEAEAANAAQQTDQARAEEAAKASATQAEIARRHEDARQLIHTRVAPELRPHHTPRPWRVLPWTEQPGATRPVLSSDDASDSDSEGHPPPPAPDASAEASGSMQASSSIPRRKTSRRRRKSTPPFITPPVTPASSSSSSSSTPTPSSSSATSASGKLQTPPAAGKAISGGLLPAAASSGKIAAGASRMRQTQPRRQSSPHTANTAREANKSRRSHVPKPPTLTLPSAGKSGSAARGVVTTPASPQALVSTGAQAASGPDTALATSMSPVSVENISTSAATTTAIRAAPTTATAAPAPSTTSCMSFQPPPAPPPLPPPQLTGAVPPPCPVLPPVRSLPITAPAAPSDRTNLLSDIRNFRTVVKLRSAAAAAAAAEEEPASGENENANGVAAVVVRARPSSARAAPEPTLMDSLESAMAQRRRAIANTQAQLRAAEEEGNTDDDEAHSEWDDDEE